ncbi:uncharacterized protein LOC142776460 [Rhipicephalus microplus]|uniref:uncharacterized protein LOC142776460 n=1 Tax=Rhipicephalus microplus TaxID=6941 RepID=UPI003F6B719E
MPTTARRVSHLLVTIRQQRGPRRLAWMQLMKKTKVTTRTTRTRQTRRTTTTTATSRLTWKYSSSTRRITLKILKCTRQKTTVQVAGSGWAAGTWSRDSDWKENKSCSLVITMTRKARSVDITELSGDIIKLVFKRKQP